ncbi:MAG: hypothetical protein NT047_11460 [Deltaproteobacteria bacterium]|nr:hypothetical protein [Deltaproteobacteria bacterium]
MPRALIALNGKIKRGGIGNKLHKFRLAQLTGLGFTDYLAAEEIILPCGVTRDAP